jgi:hypothetical protein
MKNSPRLPQYGEIDEVARSNGPFAATARRAQVERGGVLRKIVLAAVVSLLATTNSTMVAA